LLVNCHRSVQRNHAHAFPFSTFQASDTSPMVGHSGTAPQSVCNCPLQYRGAASSVRVDPSSEAC